MVKDLLNFTEFIGATFVLFHALFGHVEMCRVTTQLLLVLRHLFDHLREIPH